MDPNDELIDRALRWPSSIQQLPEPKICYLRSECRVSSSAVPEVTSRVLRTDPEPGDGAATPSNTLLDESISRGVEWGVRGGEGGGRGGSGLTADAVAVTVASRPVVGDVDSITSRPC